ncbi:MAG: AmmeMemoRadiSam system protein A [Desulfobacterales bacterium]|jgi:uncharacterized protein|nr:AmmeMemoRadiSam system protein A [Desulfobacteraceae bacterium]MBT4364878.1 AmmeMemoRadiSam system protein A [Desulfobacteraceae bacterium]MBT7086626.1 AmmeMemoRadiSam system protein A [Desulfobacterales bacterium]
MKIICILAFILCMVYFSNTEKISAQDSFLTQNDKEFLLNLSRQTLYWYIKDDTIPEVDKSVIGNSLQEKLSCFVTLDKKGTGLRGCIGHFDRKRPLYENIISRTIAAATQDPRFDKVKYEELRDIKIEISVLTKPHKLSFESSKDLLAKLRPYVDGVILETKYGSSTYLPQVWEQIPDKEQFLSYLCRKHGAPDFTWKYDYENIKVSTYQAIVFGEEIYGRKVVGKKGAVVGKNGASVIGSAASFGKRHIRNETFEESAILDPGTIVSPESDINNIR